MKETTFTYEDPDGVEIFVYKWTPDAGTTPRAAVQVAHGMAEHAGRYRRFAEALTGAGFVVYADDHRGHGKTAGDLAKAGVVGPDGWNATVADLKQLSDRIKEEWPDLPLFLFGHSYGSFLSQDYIQRWGASLQGVILSGTNGSQPVLGIASWLARRQVKKHGAETPSAFLDKLSFGAFNKKFKPTRTDFDWLSRDAAEVQKYVDDPWCGWVAPGQFFVELLKGFKKIWADEHEARIPADLPVFFVAGTMDPVGKYTKNVRKLAARYAAQGLHDVEEKYYEGGRHEMLNETNRAEVTADIIAWLEAHL